MPATNEAYVNFTGGEYTPLLDARADWQKYKNGARIMKNFVPLIWGAATRRPPTRFVAEVKDSSKRTGLIPFQYSTLTNYMIEAGDLYFRFYKDKAQIYDATDTIDGATQTNPVAITANGHPFSNGNQVVATDAGGMTEINNRRFTVASAAANTLELSGLDGTGFDAFTSGGSLSRPYELATPFAQADLFDAAGRLKLNWTQSTDTMYLVHASYHPRKLTRSGHTSWAIAEIDFIDGPYLAERSDLTITPSGTTGSVNLTASAALWAATDVGRLVRLNHSSTWTWAKITAYTSTTVVVATIRSAATTAGATTSFRLGAWSATTGFPEAVVFHKERLFFAQGQRLDGSQAGNFETFTPGTADDDAVSYTLASDSVENIRHLVSARQLLVLTQGGEWTLGGTTAAEAITPTNVSALKQTRNGTILGIRPAQVENAVLFAQRSTRRFREFAYRFEADNYSAPDLNRFADHVGRGGFIACAYQAEPYSILWSARADGTLLSFTYQRVEDVVPWARHTLGGTAAKVEALSVIPTDDLSHGDNQDQLWLVVSRTIGGQTKRYVEVMDPFQIIIAEGEAEGTDTAPADLAFVDCLMSYSGVAATSITGLGPLIGEAIEILADAAEAPIATVSAKGRITLAASATEVRVGLGYTADLKPMKPEAPSSRGSGQAAQKRINDLAIRFYRTGTMQVGRSPATLKRIPFRNANDPTDAAVPLFTGDKSGAFFGTWDNAGDMYLRASGPLPCTVLGIFPEITVNG